MSNSKSNKHFPVGFTAVDNRIYYIQDRLSPSAFSIFMRIHRMSEGYDGEYKSLSNTYFQKVCNISKNTVTKAVKELEKLGVIKTQRRSRSNTLYCINMSNLSNIYNSIVNDDSQSMTECGTVIQPTDSQELSSSKENLIKQNSIKENINIPFSDFWDKYDYCKGKKTDVEAKWVALSDEERTLTMESLDKYKQSTPDKTYRKYPMSYLNTEAWNDEHVVPVTTNTTNIVNNNVFSASHKEFEPVITVQEAVKDTNSTKHTKDDLECNLEALGISSGKGLDDRKTKDCTIKDNNNKNINTPVDIVALSSQIHWSELKARGMLKTPVNTNAVIPNTDTDKKINEFLARNSSKRFGGICKDIT